MFKFTVTFVTLSMVAAAFGDDDGSYHPGKYGEDGSYNPSDDGKYSEVVSIRAYRPVTYTKNVENTPTNYNSAYVNRQIVRPVVQVYSQYDQNGRYNQDQSGQYNPAINRQYGQGLIGQYNPTLSGQYVKKVNLNQQFNRGLSGQYNQNLNAQYNRGLSGQYKQNLNAQYNQNQIHDAEYYNNRAYTSNNAEAASRILRQDAEVLPEGYHFVYETENNIQAEEDGRLTNLGSDHESLKVTGFYEYIGPDNVKYRVDYIADENGFQPIGEHLPTPPPLPEAYARLLQTIPQ